MALSMTQSTIAYGSQVASLTETALAEHNVMFPPTSQLAQYVLGAPTQFMESEVVSALMPSTFKDTEVRLCHFWKLGCEHCKPRKVEDKVADGPNDEPTVTPVKTSHKRRQVRTRAHQVDIRVSFNMWRAKIDCERFLARAGRKRKAAEARARREGLRNHARSCARFVKTGMF